MRISTAPLGFQSRRISSHHPIKPGNDMSKITKDQTEAQERARANRPDAHISQGPEVTAYRQHLLARMPEWREEQIRRAHLAMMRKRRPLTHPVRIGDLG